MLLTFGAACCLHLQVVRRRKNITVTKYWSTRRRIPKKLVLINNVVRTAKGTFFFNFIFPQIQKQQYLL
jgi:hypothetical protein